MRHGPLRLLRSARHEFRPASPLVGCLPRHAATSPGFRAGSFSFRDLQRLLLLPALQYGLRAFAGWARSPSNTGAAIVTDWQSQLDKRFQFTQWRELAIFGASPGLVARRAQGGAPVYVATPYSRSVVDHAGRWSVTSSERAVAVAVFESVRLVEQGLTAISPIAIAGAMIHANLAQDWGFRLPDPLNGAAWLKWCGPLMCACSAIVVPDLPGADSSAGVFAEVVEAIERNKPIYFYGN